MNCIGVLNSFGKRRARSAGFERHFGSDGDHANFFWPFLADRDDCVIRSDEGDNEAAEKCGADIVSVFFQIRSETQRRLLRQFLASRARTPARCRQRWLRRCFPGQRQWELRFGRRDEQAGAEDFHVPRRAAWRAGSDFLPARWADSRCPIFRDCGRWCGRPLRVARSHARSNTAARLIRNSRSLRRDWP